MLQTNEVLKACRRELGDLSQGEFGGKIGVTAMTVSRWERCESLPRRKHWSKLEEVTGRPIEQIIAAGKLKEAAE